MKFAKNHFLTLEANISGLPGPTEMVHYFPELSWCHLSYTTLTELIGWVWRKLWPIKGCSVKIGPWSLWRHIPEIRLRKKIIFLAKSSLNMMTWRRKKNWRTIFPFFWDISKNMKFSRYFHNLWLTHVQWPPDHLRGVQWPCDHDQKEDRSI